MSYSQLEQDMDVIQFYKSKKNGYFVEIGASDGIKLSNTYLLEYKYNWTGICVEPIPDKYKLLCQNRKQSHCSDFAVYNESSLELNFDIANNYDLLSGISSHIDCHANTVNKNKKQIIVKTITLNDLLDKFNAPNFIDYLSLDTEGSEYEILKSCDFNKYKFGLIHLEHNYIEPRRTQMKELLLKNGYIFMRENKWDDYYRHSSL